MNNNGNEEEHNDMEDFVEGAFDEETAAEFTPNELPVESYSDVEDANDHSAGSVTGYLGIILAVLSFFWMPWLFGFGAVIFGMISAMRRDTALGVTALVIGSASLIVQMFYYFGFWY